MATLNIEGVIDRIDSSVIASACAFRFGYPSAVNQDHSDTYPLCILEPPTSVFTNAYDNKEQFTFILYIYRPQDNDSLRVTYKKLQGLLKSIMQAIFLNYEDKMILNGEVRIERVNDVQNDRLVGIIVDLPVNVFSNCLLY